MTTKLPADGESPPADSVDTSADHHRSSRRELFGRWAIPLAALIASLAVTIRTHFFFIVPYAVPVSNDEGYLAGMALRMVRGHWLPYVDGVSQRGPVLYWITTLFMRIGGLWSWVPIRLLGLILAIAISLLVFSLGATLFSPMAGAVAVVVSTYFLSYELNPWDGVGVNGEPLAVAFALGAALVIARVQLGLSPRPKRAIAWTGVLLALAGLSKQMFLLHAVPVGLWLLLGAETTVSPAPWRERFRQVGILVGAFAVPYVLVVGLYAATGHLQTFVYYYQRYGRDIFMDPLTPEFMRDKVREQIDRYYLGVAALGIMWFAAVGRALRASLATKLDDPNASSERLRLSPEALTALNIPVPGLGFLLTRGGTGYGIVSFVIVVAVIVGRFIRRRMLEVPFTVSSLARDIAVWIALGLVAAIATGLFIARRYPRVEWRGMERVRRNASGWFTVVQTVAAFSGALFTFRFFPHYFVELFPFAAVTVGYVGAQSFGDLDADDKPALANAAALVVGAIVLLVIGNSAVSRNVRMRRESDRWYQDPAADPIVRYVLEKTTPDQSIFVWGFRAETYLSAHRYPGSRYVYTVYPAGVVPWFQATHEEEERRVVPGSREQLLDDLEREQPELVIDAGRSMNGRYMYNYPVLRSYLDRKYCFMRYVDGEPVYRRRHGDRCPPADY